MNPARFFIDRPRFATVMSLVIVLVGALAYFQLPVAQYPEIAPPTIEVTASYPGADPLTIAESVATPLEQEVNGVEGMLYMESRSSDDGTMRLTITFELGTDVDEAQVLVQNRVTVAEPRLPAEVRQIGVTTRKSAPGILMVAHILSPDGTRDNLYLGNLVYTQIRDELARTDGVGNVQVFGGSQYSMRIWLDVNRLASLDLTPGDVVNALQEQNVQVAAGSLGREPMATPGAFEVLVTSRGRLREADEFRDVIVKSESNAIVRLKDVARVELGAQEYVNYSRLDTDNAVAVLITQRSGANAVATADRVLDRLDELSQRFPAGVEHRVVYNPTEFVQESIDEVFVTLFITAIIVAVTVFVFLQGWRATMIPVVAIPISLVGTFAVMQVLGLSLNTLSLFGLTLAIGIVVDDAIVVVENVDRLLREGHTPKEAARKAMDEVSSALIATTLVLIAVFVPTTFIDGISGQFYTQFALTIAASTAISTFVSLTLSPALAGILLRPKSDHESLMTKLGAKVFSPFNWALDRVTLIYTALVKLALRLSLVMLLIFAGLLSGTYFMLKQVPQGFIPPQDQGYLIVAIQLPDGASLARTDEVAIEATSIALGTPGIEHAVVFTGFSGATFSNSTNAAALFVTLEDAADRATRGLSADAIVADLQARCGAIDQAMVIVVPPPPVQGIGTGGGFKMQIQDLASGDPEALKQAAWAVAMTASQDPDLQGVFTTFSTGKPQIFADIDTTRARMLDVPISAVNETLQSYLGSTYVNDFNFLGRTNRVIIQAESAFRDESKDILRLQTRSNSGAVVSLGSLVKLEDRTAPSQVVRYNLYQAADVIGNKSPRISTGESLDKLEAIADSVLPSNMSYEWTDLSYQERSQGNTAVFVFALSVLFVFLTLTAQYESWSLPLAIVLVVPLCILFGLLGVWFRGMDNNVLVQIGFVLLIGLACKNAILIVEFAKANEDEGMSPFDAAVEACRLRLRPILMTALSFILGVLPLMFATGAGAEMRRVLGTTVFSGMTGVTVIGLILTPVFYYVLRRIVKGRPQA